MKKSLKKAGALLLAMASILSTAAFPASATSVAGAIGPNAQIFCRGSNSITSTGASATTTASQPVTLSVTLHYYYVNETTGIVTHKQVSDANSPRTSIIVTCSKPSGTNYRSYRCWSEHHASGNGSWGDDTDSEYFYE